MFRSSVNTALVVLKKNRLELKGPGLLTAFCNILGTTSVNGPGSLVHLGSLKCIHTFGGGVSEGNKLVIYSGCILSR